MYIVKLILLIVVFCTSTIIGFLISKKYTNRLQILKDLKNALNIFEIKVNFSCDTISETFEEISEKIKGTTGKIFSDTVKNLNNMMPSEAWEDALQRNSENLKQEDINSLKPLGKLLGRTDIEGQINQIKLVSEFVEQQIVDAVDEKNKNEKMYKKLGAIVGLVIVIVLI